MKLKKQICAAAFVAGLMTFQLIAQAGQAGHHHYKLIDLGTFGGPDSYLNYPNSYGQILNNAGALAGWATTATPDPYSSSGFCFNPDCFVSRAFEWHSGVRSKFPGLDARLSSQSTWISSNGIVAGISQNGQLDPSFPGFPVTHGVIWRDGVITDLGTMEGGFESAALAVNSHGQVVGAADNTKPASTLIFGFNFGWATQTRAFLWQDGVMQDLHTLGGSDAVAYLINENGQVAGVSYVDSKPSEYCSNISDGGYALTTGAFLWTNGKMQNLGNFGGTCTFAFDLNDNGQVIGGSTLRGDQAQHPFLWNNGALNDLGTFGGDIGNAVALNEGGVVVGLASYPGDQIFHGALWVNGNITDLGTLSGDSFSSAYSINSHGQIVGISAPQPTTTNPVAFLWENGGPMVDLNSLVPAGSSLVLGTPLNINDRGQIGGVATDAMGNQHAFLLLPCDENRSDIEGCD